MRGIDIWRYLEFLENKNFSKNNLGPVLYTGPVTLLISPFCDADDPHPNHLLDMVFMDCIIIF
jgi:hypothetical protein